MELSNFASILLYLAVFLSAICFAYIGQKKKNKIFIALALILPIVLVGFRYSSGTDSLTYRNFYAEVGTEDFSFTMARLMSRSIEPFIVFVSVIGNFFHLPASFLLLVFAAVTILALYGTARLFNKDRAWLYYGALLLILFPESMNMMRQIAAISVQAYALMFIYKAQRDNERIRWSVVVLLTLFAVTLHYSTLLLLPVLLLPLVTKNKYWRSIVLGLSIVALICIFAFPTIINLGVNMGLVSEKHLVTFLEAEGSIINIKFFGALSLFSILLANYKRTKSISDKQMSLLMLVGILYAGVGFHSGYLGRIAMFFWIFIIIAAIDVICQLLEKERHRAIAGVTCATLYFVFYYLVLGLNSILPYSFAL